MPDETIAPSSKPARLGLGLAEQRRRRKIALLALLLVLLALLAYAAYYYNQHRRLPLSFATEAVAEVPTPEYLFSITGGDGAGKMKRPTGVAIGKNDRVYVTDMTNRRVQVYTREGRFLFTFDKIGGGKKLRSPVHAAINPKGELFISDRRLRQIFVFDLDGKFLRQFAPEGKTDYKWSPLALSFDEKGNLYVSDVGSTEKHRMLVFAPDGTKLADFGKTAHIVKMTDAPGDFYFPNGVTVSGDELFVADGNNRRIQIFDLKGQFKKLMLTAGVPRGITSGLRETDAKPQPLLYVVDALAHQVDVYEANGERMTNFGSAGVGPGQFAYPNDIALDQAGRIYVSDRDNAQVQVWAWPQDVVPPIPTPETPTQWALCLSPLLLLAIPLARRKRPFTVTPDFVDAMVGAGWLRAMDQPKLRFYIPQADHPPFDGLVEQGIDLARLLIPDVHSESDAAALKHRLEVDDITAARLSMALRTKRLATEDPELKRLGVLLGIDVYGRDEFMQTYGEKFRTPEAP